VPPASENPRFRFWYWFSFNSSSDWGEVQIKTENGTWESISNLLKFQGGDAWSYGSIDISAYADSTVQLAFRFHSINDGSSNPDVSSGWYIDDVSLITGPYVFNNPEDFETGFGDWSVDEGSWEVDIPTVGPSNAHSGQNCAGTNLDGNYQESSDTRLVSPPFTVPPVSENPAFRFWHWFSFSSSGDWGEIQITTDGGINWLTISEKFIYTSSGTWSAFYLSMSSYADSLVQLAFRFHSINDGSSNPDVSSGWYIDDINIDGLTTGVNENNNLNSNESKLSQNFPNPFSHQTKIEYNILNDENVRLSIYNINGELVEIILDKRQKRGNHSVTWQGKNEHNKRVSPGIYFYELKTGNNLIRKKMLLLK
jgi:hypothetical protein